MAEYMDIARIDDWNDLSILDDNGNATYVYDVGELPRVDVVEREKIDNAIKEMEIEYTTLDYHTNKSLGASYGIRKALEILKRNIGE